MQNIQKILNYHTQGVYHTIKKMSFVGNKRRRNVINKMHNVSNGKMPKSFRNVGLKK